MSARDDILRAVRAARAATFAGGEPPPLPALPVAPRVWGEAAVGLVEQFTAAALAAASNVVRIRRAALPQVIEATGGVTPSAASERVGDDLRVLSMVTAIPGTVALPDDPHALASLDLFICEGVIGVAENGAIWLPASQLGERAALVLATEVIVVLPRSAIVPTMHAAYAAVDVSAEAFGVFLAGPSKTADIEQSLVIGAHGAKGLTVCLVDD